jgi:RNA polymerase sigma-70 factor (ECF subfamily)
MSQLPNEIREELLALMPTLRAFARSLAGNRAESDDLVQETMVKAISNINQFDRGTNLRAWLFTILRNTYYTTVRRRRREVEDASGNAASQLSVGPQQEWSAAMHALRGALDRLPDDQREALILVGAAGMTYEEAAEVCGCALGTIKSRVNRGRNRLLEILHADGPGDVLSDNDFLSAVRQKAG